MKILKLENGLKLKALKLRIKQHQTACTRKSQNPYSFIAHHSLFL